MNEADLKEKREETNPRPTGVVEERRGPFLISTDPRRLDLDVIHNYLSQESYWAAGVDRDTVARSLQGSLCFGVYHDGDQIGLARAITDRATYAYVADVFILAEFRGRGLGKWLMQCVRRHPQLQGLRKWALHTRDAHGLYEQYGFKRLQETDRYMEYWPDDER